MHAMCACPQLVCCQFLKIFVLLFRVHNPISLSYILGCDATYVYVFVFMYILLRAWALCFWFDTQVHLFASEVLSWHFFCKRLSQYFRLLLQFRWQARDLIDQIRVFVDWRRARSSITVLLSILCWVIFLWMSLLTAHTSVHFSVFHDFKQECDVRAFDPNSLSILSLSVLCWVFWVWCWRERIVVLCEWARCLYKVAIFASGLIKRHRLMHDLMDLS